MLVKSKIIRKVMSFLTNPWSAFATLLLIRSIRFIASRQHIRDPDNFQVFLPGMCSFESFVIVREWFGSVCRFPICHKTGKKFCVRQMKTKGWWFFTKVFSRYNNWNRVIVLWLNKIKMNAKWTWIRSVIEAKWNSVELIMRTICMAM